MASTTHINLGGAEASLVSGSPYWGNRRKARKRFPKLKGDLVCDVAIVGGGITGALAAYQLAKQGYECAVLERGRVGNGSTIASTALISYDYDLLLAQLVSRIGKPKALESYRLCRDAVTELANIVHKVGSACNYESKVSLRVSNVARHKRLFEDECALRNEHHIAAELLSERDMATRYGVTARFGLLSKDAAQLDPYQLCLDILSHLNGSCAFVHENTKVTGLEESKTRVTVTTANDVKLSVKFVVFTTGYESERYLPRKLARLTTDYCFVSHPVRRLEGFDKCHLVEHKKSYLYMSTFGKRVLVGAEGETLHKPGERRSHQRSRTNELLVRSANYFQDRPLIPEYRWSGTFAKSKDSLPYLDNLSASKRVFFLLGYGGNGIASSAMLSRLLVSNLRGTGPNRTLFSFDR